MEERVASVHDLRDGEMKRVQVGGKNVLLARVDGQFYAHGDRCPHYGAPLHEGTLHAHRLTCPWHQGTFDITAGNLLEPPSLDGLPSFTVRVQGDDVFVDRPDNAASATTPAHVRRDADDRRLFVIVGGGAAGAAAAEALREDGYTGRILMLSQEDRWPYDRPNLTKDYLAGTMEASWLALRPASFWADHDVERRFARVTALDVRTRQITFTDLQKQTHSTDDALGETLIADAILIATGGRPRRLDLPGAGLANIFTLRSREDCDAIIAALPDAQRVVIVGSSFIGLEAAASLRTRGLDVTVTGPEEVPFVQTLGRQVGERIQRLHEQKGTKFRLGVGVSGFRAAGRVHGSAAADAEGPAAIDDEPAVASSSLAADSEPAAAGGPASTLPAVAGVELADGSFLPADLVVVGVGVTPAVDFVAGVTRNPDGSLDANENLQIAAGVWAAGDIVRYPAAHLNGRRVRGEHWRLAEQQGRAAAHAMAAASDSLAPGSTTAAFRGVPFFWTQQFTSSFDFVGYGGAWDELIITGDVDGDFTVLYAQAGQFIAACGTQSQELAAFAELMRAGLLPAVDEMRGQVAAGLAQRLANHRNDG
jgi:NADPH-dependent 2,4-dienoyl-CoA reductase/sulfur reductase-like enzyme/nitrite reductase/ring-hydroxylating ferredoxin subunit